MTGHLTDIELVRKQEKTMTSRVMNSRVMSNETA